MKNILIATTALVASAGIASAEITFSGSAGAGVYHEPASGSVAAGDKRTAESGVYSFAEIVATMEAEADNGLVFGATMDATAGEKFDKGDFEFDGTKTGELGLGSIYVSFGGAKLTFANEDIDDLYDDDYSHDIQFDYEVGGFSMSTTVDDTDTPGESQYSYSLAYTTNGVTGKIVGNDLTDNQMIDISYAGEGYKVGLNYDLDGEVTEVYGEYSTNGVTVSANYNTEEEWDFGVEYSANGLTVGATTDEADEWELTGSYDLGGGLSLVAGVNYADAYYTGLAMSF